MTAQRTRAARACPRCFGTLGGFQGVAIQANSSENIFGLAASIGGGVVGVAGAVDVAIVHVQTKAFVGPSAQVNQQSGANSAQSVDVAAADYVKTLTVAGGAAGGLVGIGGGVDVGILDETTQAYLGAGSSVNAKGNVDVYALSQKQHAVVRARLRRRLRRRRGRGLGVDDRHPDNLDL